MSFLHELRRRKVFRLAALYIVGAWVVLQVADLAFESWDIASSALRYIWLGAILGFPVALIFGWRYDITAHGIVRTPPVDTGAQIDLSLRRADRIILTLLMAVSVGAIYQITIQISESSTAGAEEIVQHDTEPNSIAVLPFANMSSDPEQEYFSDGITEEILNLLVKIPELKVTSRTSVFTFKGQNVDIPTVAKKLGVAHILEGSVRKAGNQVRITTQLIEAGNDVHLWSETYERQLDDIFAIQDEIAREVVKALQIQLLGEAPLAISTNTEAYNLYLRGKHFATMGTPEGLESSIKAYQESISLDGDFAPTWAGLSIVLRWQGQYGIADLYEATEASRGTAMRALEIDNTLAEAWLALAEIQFRYDWDWSNAEVTTRTALKYGPQNAPVLRLAGSVALSLGEMERALGLAQLAVDLDPLEYSGLAKLGTTYWALGQLKEEERIYRRILELYPDSDSHSVKSWLAATLTRQGKPEEGLQYLIFDSENRWQRAMSAIVLHSLGRHEEERPIRQNMIDEYSQTWAFGIVLTYAWHGDLDKAFEWLDIAFKQKDLYMTQLVYNPWLAPLHDDPRWEKILDKMGLLKYWTKSQAKREEAEL
jgi:TolB-like protein